MLVSMKLGSSTRYSRPSQSQKRPKAAASAGPHVSAISAAMRSRPCHTRMVEPSAKVARYIGLTGFRRTKSAMSA